MNEQLAVRQRSSGDSSTYVAKEILQAAVAPDFLSALKAEDRERVLNAGQLQQYCSGESIFIQGERHQGILVILEGVVRSFYVAPSGREITLAYWKRGHFVGGPEILGGGTHTWSGEAVHDSRLLFYPAPRLRQLILEIPQFALNVIESVSFKSKCFSALIQLLGTRPIGSLLAQLLVILARDQGGGDRMLLDPHYSQEELAKLVGGTRQWVASSLKRMKQAQLIDIENGRIVVLSLSRLEQYAD